MTLIEPNFFSRYKTWLIFGGLGLLLIGIALFLYDCGSNAWFRSKVQKDKDAIKSDLDVIANQKALIAEAEKKQAAAQANVNTATEELNKQIFGREELKKESNQALANVQAAISANTNVDRTVEEAKRVLDKLDKLDQ